MSPSHTPDRKRGPWTVLEARQAYENPWMRVREFDVLRPDGSPGLYGVVEPANLAIGILPVFEDGSTVLVGQYRFALDAYSWELPEGGGPKAQDPLVSAQRELAEETGYSADYWAPLLDFDVSNSITDERAICYLAWGLEAGEPDRESSESDMITRRLPLHEAITMAMSGEIRDSLTLLMLLTAQHKARAGMLDPHVSRIILSEPA